MIRINLIRHLSRGRPPVWRPRPIAVALVTTTFLAAVHLAQAATLASLEERHAAVANEIESLRGKLAAVSAGSLPDSSSATGAHDASTSAERLRNLAEAVPSNLWIETYRQGREEVTIRGVSVDDAPIEVFARQLAAAGDFRRLEITETALSEPRNAPVAESSTPALYRFTIVCEVSGPDPTTDDQRG